jgi:hypothetical protein
MGNMKKPTSPQEISISKHPKANAALFDKTRFQFWLAGRRGGKTVRIRERIIQKAIECPKGGEIFYIGPTNQDAKDLIWEALEDRLDDLGWDYKPLVSKQRFELSHKRKIYVIGGEKIRRIRGHKVYHAFLDELAFFTADLNQVWRAVRPALSDLKGGVTCATTPNGKGTQAYDFWMASISDPEWARHVWHTLDNPGIDPLEIDSAKKNLDEKSFSQEYLATWESFEGLAYYTFNENLHIKKQPEINPELPLALSFDFNVNPTSLLLIQNQEIHRVKKEYSLKNSSTIETVKKFCHEFDHLKEKLHLFVHGDSAGSNRHSTTGFSDYHYIKELLTHYGYRFQTKIMAKNPAIIDRVSAVNSYLLSAVGTNRIEIDPSCTELIRDLSSQPLDGRFPSDKNNLGHKADALGYYIYWQHIVGNRRPQETIEL